MEFQKSEGRIFAQDENGNLLAEITFPTVAEGVADIDHTFVDESLRGQGVAGKLVRAAVDQLRSQGKKAKTSCWYAAQWFEKHPEEKDLLASRKTNFLKKASKSVLSSFTAWSYPAGILGLVKRENKPFPAGRRELFQ